MKKLTEKGQAHNIAVQFVSFINAKRPYDLSSSDSFFKHNSIHILFLNNM